ncbi:MAG: hypothetical protein AB8G15_18755 [Saprospiraceae bacterium]
MLSLIISLLLGFTNLNTPLPHQEVEGTICVWVHESIKIYEEDRVLELKVYLDGKWIGMIHKSFAETPTCGLPGVLTKKIKAGKHTIEVKGIRNNALNHTNQLKVNWKGQFVLLPNAHILLEIGNHDTPKVIEPLKEDAGSLSVWLDQSVTKNVRDIKVYIAGKYQGRLKKGFTKERICGDIGTISKKLPFGRHEVKVVGIRKDLKASDPKRKFEFKRNVLLKESCFNLPIYFYSD